MIQTVRADSSESSHAALQSQFLRWQCRVRQIAVRENGGRPDDASMPQVIIGEAAFGQIITVMSKRPPYSKTAEMQHLYRHTLDPAIRRDKALQFFAENYYQRAGEFSDILTAVFLPASEGAQHILQARQCRLRFEMYRQIFDLACEVMELEDQDSLRQSTWWHNALFNPNLQWNARVLAFAPNWQNSVAA